MPSQGTSIDPETIYRTAFEAWKFQVDQYWTRSSYFVVFELAFAAGIWKIFERKHWFTSAAMSIGAIVFTVVWVLNNERLNEYIKYYWVVLKQLESELDIPVRQQIFSPLYEAIYVIQTKRYSGNYRQYARVLPPLFFCGWVWMLIWSSRLIASSGF